MALSTMPGNETNQVVVLHAKLDGLISDIEAWDQTERLIRALPNQLTNIWASLKDIQRSCEELQRTVLQHGLQWYLNGLTKQLSLDAGIEVVTSLADFFQRRKMYRNTSIPLSESKYFGSARRKLMECKCQIECYTGILNR